MYLLTITVQLGLLLLTVVVAATWALYVSSMIRSSIAGAPFVPIPKKLVRPIVAMAGIKSDDVFYDLGCGDGRILDAALEAGAAKAVGCDVAWFPLWLARRRLRRWGSRAQCHLQDVRSADVADATVVYFYLLTNLTDMVAGSLARTLRPGTTVLCPTFPIDTVRHPAFELLESKKLGNFTIYRYRKT